MKSKRAIFFTKQRSGSTFLQRMLFGIPGSPDMSFVWNMKYPHSLKTKSSKCDLYYVDTKEEMAQRSSDNSAIQIFMQPVSFLMPSNILALSKEYDWKFIYLLRDPRDRFESNYLWAIEKGSTVSREDFMQAEILEAKRQLKDVVNSLDDPRFYLLKFEDFILDPLKSFTEVFNFLGYNIDQEFYGSFVEEQMNFINSSFKDKGQKSAYRKQLLSQAEKSVFNKELGHYLKTIGYE